MQVEADPLNVDPGEVGRAGTPQILNEARREHVATPIDQFDRRLVAGPAMERAPVHGRTCR